MTTLKTKREAGKKKIILAHRVNTIGKAIEASQIFDGIEVDVTVRASEVLAAHGLDVATNLNLEDLLILADRVNPRNHYWLDVKTSSLEEYSTVLMVLKKLDTKLALRNRVLLEINYDLLKEMPADPAPGWNVSLYFPGDPGKAAQREYLHQLEQEIPNLLQLMKAKKVKNLSFDVRFFDLVRKNTANYPQIKLHTWDTGAVSDKLSDMLRINELDSVEYVLVAFPCPFNK